MPDDHTPPNPARLDLRVRRTRRLLREALLGLLREKRFDTITVQEVTERAQVSRGAFYLHYRDKDDLLTQSTKEMLTELLASLEKLKFSPETLREGLELWLRHVAAHAELYHIMLDRSGAHAAQLRSYLEKRIEPTMDALSDGVPRGIRLRFLVSAYMGVTEWWLSHKMPYPMEKMAEWLCVLTLSVTRPRSLLPGTR